MDNPAAPGIVLICAAAWIALICAAAWVALQSLAGLENFLVYFRAKFCSVWEQNFASKFCNKPPECTFWPPKWHHNHKSAMFYNVFLRFGVRGKHEMNSKYMEHNVLACFCIHSDALGSVHFPALGSPIPIETFIFASVYNVFCINEFISLISGDPKPVFDQDLHCFFDFRGDFGPQNVHFWVYFMK